MRVFDRLCPAGPDWVLGWDAATAAFAWLRSPADAAAARALAALPGWRALPRPQQVRLFAAALLHDAAEPDGTAAEDRAAAPGPGLRASLTARRILWELGAPADWREHVAALVRHRRLPLRALERPDLRRRVLAVSLTASNADLALLAAAGSDAPADDVDLFAQYCAELGVLERAWPFASDHARFQYFRTPGRDPGYPAFDDTRATMTVMSGLPGVGKDHWIGRHRPDTPVVSLDAWRARLRVSPAGDQRPVVAAAYEQARGLLRAGAPLVWNATNVSRRQRDMCIGLAASYRYRVEIVALEAAPAVVRARNSSRDAVVPAAVLKRLIRRWEVPDLTEAHAVHRIDTGIGTGMMDHFT